MQCGFNIIIINMCAVRSIFFMKIYLYDLELKDETVNLNMSVCKF